MESIDRSLQRLGTDYLDIYYCHRFDPETEIEEIVRAMDDLVHRGKILYWGTSVWSAAQIERAVGIARDLRAYAPVVEQPRYNMLDRDIEWDLPPQTETAGTGVIVFCPLSSGLLTDKYLGGDIPAESRAAQKWGKDWVKRNLSDERRAMLQQLNEMAKQRGQTLAQMALAWILRLPGITSALTGSSSVKQVEENVAALAQAAFSEEELAKIDALTKPGP